MTQLGMAVASLNQESVFQAAYERGIKKSEYWEATLEDCLNLIARLPALAARIYRNVYHPGRQMLELDSGLDLVGTRSDDFPPSPNHFSIVTCRQLLPDARIRGQP